MSARFRLLVAALALVLWSGRAPAGPNDELLKTVPPTANVFALFDVKELLASPIGQKAGWIQKTDENYRAGVGIIPPGTDRLAVSGQLNLAGGAWAWKAAVLEGQGLPTPADVAAREKGEVDEVAGFPVVLSPRRAYFVGLSPARQAVFQPASRADLSAWARQSQSPAAQGPSKYLAGAVKWAQTAPVVISVDLTDSIDPVTARDVAGSLFTVIDKNTNLAAFGKFLSKTRGVTLTVKATDHLQASVRVDFAESPIKFEKVVKAAFLEILDNEGAAVPEMEKWEMGLGDSSMILSGTLSPESFGRIVGLFSFPKAGGEMAEPAGPSGPATKRYYLGVNAAIEDVRQLSKESRYEKTALWHEAAARKIEHLDPRGVDPTMVETGLGVAKRLRAMAGSLRGVPIDAAQLQSTQYAYVWAQPAWGLWGFPLGPTNISANTNIPQVQAQIGKVVAGDVKNRQQLWEQISGDMSQTRAKMVAKYKDF